MVRAAIPEALAVAHDHGVTSIAATLIGTRHRMTADQAIRALVDGPAGAKHPVRVRWSLPEPAHRQLADEACNRLGLTCIHHLSLGG